MNARNEGKKAIKPGSKQERKQGKKTRKERKEE